MTAPTPADGPAARRQLAGVAALFLCSGASGLVFEVVWVRLLALRVGGDAVAVSLVVAAFLAGVGLGSLVAGPWADASARPLRLYAALEAVTGVAGLAVSALLARPGALPAGAPLAARVALAFALLLPPTVAMGATLPVLTRHVTRDLAHLGRSFGLLYALNTLGAAAGCALAGFALVGALGFFRTALAAAGLNLAVALAAALWDAARPAPPRVEAPPPPAAGGRAVPWLPVALAAATGFAAIACEVLWFRVLRAFVKSSTYAFSLLLATYLVGLVLGSLAYARRLAPRPRPWDLLADVQTALAFTTLLSVALLGRAPYAAGLLQGVLGRTAQADSDLAQLALAAAVILPSAALMGASLPLVARLGAEALGRVGRGVGAVAAANTAGGVAGSLATGLALVPLVGAQRSFALASGVTMAVALAAWSRGDRGGAGRWRTARAAVALAVAWAALPSGWLTRAVAHFPRARVLEVREGVDGTAVALGYDRATLCAASRNRCAGRCARPFAFQQLVFGSISYASTIPPARRYMRALAHLPMLLHPAPARVLEVCFGTGTTAGAFTAHDELRALTLVDVNADVFALARHFAESNRAVLRDPRARAVVDDGRRFLAAGEGTFDVISLEPPPPTAEGAASLYTTEFYALARRRLAPGGVLAQWVPLDQQNEALDRALLASVRAAFPEVEVWIPSRLEGVVLASDRPLRVDLARWRARWAAPAVRASLDDVGFPSPEALLATRVLDADGARRYVAGAAPMTDDLPVVEYYRSHRGRPFALAAMLAHATDPALAAPEDARPRVRRLAAAERLLMRAQELANRGDDAAARALVLRARGEGAHTPYVDYLADTELDCLNHDHP